MGEEMHEKKRVPAIRFAGFTEPWEQRKLEDIFKEYSEKNHAELPPLTIIQGQGTILRNKSDRHLSYDKESLSGYKFVKKGDFIVHLRSFEGGLEIAKSDGIISPAYHTLHSDVANSNFYYPYFRSHNFINNKLKNCVYGIRDGKSINIQEMKKIKISYTNIREQECIAKIFTNMDNLITLHQRKCDELKKVKKSLLQKMFPKEGSVVPEVRFAGFTEAWEQRELGNFIIEYTEVTTENNQYPALTSSRKGIFLQTDYFSGNQIASEDNTGYNIVPYGYFTYRHMSDDEIFYFNINNIVENGIVSTLYPVFTTNIELDSKYLQYQLNYGYEFAKFARLQKQGGSRTYMYLNKLKKLRITIPLSIKEQKSISKVLLELDRIITLHQRKLDQLKTIKKSLLQQMFV